MTSETKTPNDPYMSDFSARLLAAVAESDDAMDALMKIGAETLGNPLCVTDRGWNLVAINEGIEMPDDEDWTELTACGYLSPESVTSGIRENLAGMIESSDRPFVYKGSGMKYPRMLAAVSAKGKTVATVAAVEFFKSFGKHDGELLSLFTNAVAAELHKRGAIRHARGMLYEDFIESLLDRRLHDPKAVKERAKVFNLDIHKNTYVFVFDVADYDPNKFSVTYMRDTLERMISGGRALVYDQKIVIASSFKRSRDVFKAELTSLGIFLKKHNIRCGISRRCAELSDLRFHYDQAITAMRVGTHLDPGRRIYPYGEYALYHIAETVCSSGGIKAYCHPAMGRLIEYDERYGTSFLKSLYIYLASFRNMSKAASSLNLHRNTLLYQIQRAGEIMEIDLSDYRTSQLIELSFRFLEYEKRQRLEPDSENMIEQEN